MVHTQSTASIEGIRPVHTRNVEARLAAELAEVAAGVGCELLHAEFRSGVLRLVLDHPDGVTLEHCQTVSKEASVFLDVADFGRGRYTLEVSSPGLDRELYGPLDYERFSGRAVRVTHVQPDDGRKCTIRGRLESFQAGDTHLAVTDERGDSHTIALADIRTARLEIEL